jgi:hypothetical protein
MKRANRRKPATGAPIYKVRKDHKLQDTMEDIRILFENGDIPGAKAGLSAVNERRKERGQTPVSPKTFERAKDGLNRRLPCLCPPDCDADACDFASICNK